MNELVFKGQDDQVLTNSLYTDTTESYKDEDGSLVVIKKTVYSKRMLDITVEMKGVLSNRPYFHTFMVSDDELDMLAALFPNNLFNDDKNNYFANEVRGIVSRFPKDFFTDEVMDMDIVIHISHRAAYTGSGRALWTLMGESKMDNINDELKPRKIRLVVVQMGLDLNCANLKAMDEMILFAFSFASQLEKELIQERTKSALEVRKQKIEQEGGFISKAGNWCTSLGGNSNGQSKGGKANGEKRRKEAMENSTNRIIAELLRDAVTPQDVDKVADKLNAMGLRTATNKEFTRNRLTALRTKINRRAEYAKSML